MQETPFENLIDFASEDRIIRLIAKERGKYSAKSGIGGNPFASDPLFSYLKSITPPHKLWKDPGRGKLPKKADHGLASWTRRKKSASVRVYRAIRKYKDIMPNAPWVEGLASFVSDIQNSLSRPETIHIETPRILAKYKEQDPESGAFIYRPICKYSDLKTKILLALTYQYILAKFDKYFHGDMLFMRAPRRLSANEYRTPQFLDAIDMVSKYRAGNQGRSIYVGECDIQKFYDIFNHDVIEMCFEDLFDEVKQNEGAKDEDFDTLRSIIHAYLSSFNYYEHVMRKNDDPSFWESRIIKHKKEGTPNPVCRFKWVSEEAFIASGCYTENTYKEAIADGKIGIPQGGALSGIMVNVVMRVVDKPIIGIEDSDRLFIRYCDDILLMHTDRTLCENYLETYYRQLVSCKLVPHPRKDVTEFKRGKKTTSGFWRAKSKNVFLWGAGEGNASDWVAFVGYEMRYTGEIRIRKDKIDAEFKRIARRYYNVIHSKEVKSGEPLTKEQKEKLMSRMDSLSKHILDYEKADNNLYTRSQARRLDKYLYRKSRRAASRIGIEDSKKAARERETYLGKVKEGRKQ